MINPLLKKLLPRTGIVLIIGRRGSGKSVTAHAILDELHYDRECYIYNFPKPEYLPNYIHTTQDLEFKEGSVVLVDEGYMNFSARKGMSQNNQFIDNLNGLARQKDLLIIYITQEAARIDINIVRGIEVLIVKALSINQVRFERKELKTFLMKVKEQFDNIQQKEQFFSSAYVSCDTLQETFEGMIIDAANPPWYWKNEISNAWAGISMKDAKIKVSDPTQTRKRHVKMTDNVVKIKGDYYLINGNDGVKQLLGKQKH